jgi:hypothetical protein
MRDKGSFDLHRGGTANTSGLQRLMHWARVDFPDPVRPAKTSSVVVATLVALVVSLIADALLVFVGREAFPSSAHYSHFAFFDYGSLTAIGVLGAGATWAAVTKISSAPRWLLARLALVVSVLLLLPDLWLLAKHEPVGGVGILMCMHVVIAVVTFFSLVWLAPEGRATPVSRGDASCFSVSTIEGLGSRREPWIAFVVAVGLDLLLGAVTVFFVPLSRPSGIVPLHGQILYLAHSSLGVLLALGAMLLFVLSRRVKGQGSGELRLAGTLALLGIAVAGIGGIATIPKGPARIMGLGLMFAGTVLAAAGASIPLIGPSAKASSPARMGHAVDQPDSRHSGQGNLSPGGPDPGQSEPPIGWALSSPPRRSKRR